MGSEMCIRDSAKLGHHPGAPHRGVKGPSGRLSDCERTCRHRRRFGELWRGRPAAPGFKFSASCARADRHHLLELLDRGVLATIETRVALPEHPRQCGVSSRSTSVSTTRRSRAPFSELAHRTRCTSAERRMCPIGSPSNARQRSGSGARQIEQRVAIAVNRLALVLLSGVSPGQGLVENLLGNLHDVCVSSTAIPSCRPYPEAKKWSGKPGSSPTVGGSAPSCPATPGAASRLRPVAVLPSGEVQPDRRGPVRLPDPGMGARGRTRTGRNRRGSR